MERKPSLVTARSDELQAMLQSAETEKPLRQNSPTANLIKACALAAALGAGLAAFLTVKQESDALECIELKKQIERGEREGWYRRTSEVVC